MKVNQLVVNGYVIDCGGWFDFDEELSQTTVKIDWGNHDTDRVTEYLHQTFKRCANQVSGEVTQGDINIIGHCDSATFIHDPDFMISGANGNAIEFIFKGGFVDMTKEEKPKRTKAKYTKHNVNDGDGKFWEVARDWSEGDPCVFHYLYNGSYFSIADNERLLSEYKNKNLYKRSFVEIDERQEFIDELSNTLTNLNPETLKSMECISRALYDLGYRKPD